jgi:hypothetical protein
LNRTRLIRRNLDFFLSRREEKGEQREKVYVGERFTVLFIQVVYQWYSSPVVPSRRVVVVAFVERYPYLIVFDVPECRRLITCPLDNVSARPRKKKKKIPRNGNKNDPNRVRGGADVCHQGGNKQRGPVRGGDEAE